MNCPYCKKKTIPGAKTCGYCKAALPEAPIKTAKKEKGTEVKENG